MQITPNILSIPPYVSTTWENINALRTEHSLLLITLKNGPEVAIPDLDESDITTIFEAHASYTQKQQIELPSLLTSSSSPFSLRLPISDSLELHKNPNGPDLPKEVLEKIATVAKAFGLEEIAPPQETCNCLYCQIGRMNTPEERISDADLYFREWEIKQTGDQFYTVRNPIEETESYNVYLGDPIGCTCGQQNCEHVKAVLQS